jgi:hypothetical protein
MEPRREEPQKALEPSAEQKPKRFRIVKLEERIAPKQSGHGTNNCGSPSLTCVGCNVYPTARCPTGECGW